jgi:hypothetical protein
MIVSSSLKDAKETRDNLHLWGSSSTDDEVIRNVHFFNGGFSNLIDELPVLNWFLHERVPGINRIAY